MTRSAKRRTLLLALIGLAALVAAPVSADDYVEGLKQRVPYYRTMTGPRAPMYEPLA